MTHYFVQLVCANKNWKKIRSVAQAVELLLCKCVALSSNHSPLKTNKKIRKINKR
jgi:hypothetical protein